MGKMGTAVINEVAKNDNFTICAGVDKMASSAVGYDFPVFNDIHKCDIEADVIIDFSRPDALPMLLRYAQAKRLPLVLASTGYNKNDIQSINFASETIPIMCSSNMSLGINMLKQLASTASAALNNNFDIEIIEKHHNTKVDSPSGTAIMLAEAINDAAGGDLEFVFDRHERSMARPKRELGIHALRGGTIPGDHTIVFAGQDEVIELTHRAYSRKIYVPGALRAAEFIRSFPCGLYNMSALLTQQQIITGTYYSENDILISVSGIRSPKLISDIFVSLKESDIMVDIISQPLPVNGEYTLSFSISKNLAEKAERIISDLLDGEKLDIRDDIVKVTVEGSGMEHHAGAAGDVLSTLSGLDIPVLLITTSETKITCCIPSEFAQKALTALKEKREDI